MKIKKLILSAALCLLLVASPGYADTLTVENRQVEVIPLDSLTTGKVDAGELTQLAGEGKEYVILASKGRTMPMKIALDFPFLKAGNGYTKVEFIRDTYIFISKTRMMISPDGRNWSPVHDMKSIKKLYDAKAGTLNIGLEVDPGKTTYLDFSINLH